MEKTRFLEAVAKIRDNQSENLELRKVVLALLKQEGGWDFSHCSDDEIAFILLGSMSCLGVVKTYYNENDNKYKAELVRYGSGKKFNSDTNMVNGSGTEMTEVVFCLYINYLSGNNVPTFNWGQFVVGALLVILFVSVVLVQLQQGGVFA